MNSLLLEAVEKWAYAQFGLVILPNQRKRVSMKIEGYLKIKNYHSERLLSALHVRDQQVIDDIVALLTIQESYFFRDVSLFYLLRKEFLPALIQQKRLSKNKNIVIWSAGCACGEELYSIAILMSELIPDIESWQLTLLGTDINVEALAKARKGLYSSISLRAVDDEVKHHYFLSQGKKYQLIEPIKKMVTFAYGNVLDKSKLVGSVDIIFCRNVFIYFDEAAIKKTLTHFNTALQKQGLLFLGCADFVRYYQEQFFMHFKEGVTYLTKSQDNETYATAALAPLSSVPPISYIEKQRHQQAYYRMLDSLLMKKKFLDVIEKVNQEIKQLNSSSVLYRYKGEALIGLGDIVTAREVLEKRLKQDKTDPICYFLLALSVMSKSKVETTAYLERAIAIKKAFPEAYYHLGMLCLGQQKFQEGLAYLKQARRYAQQEVMRKRVIGSDSNMRELLHAVSHEIAHYEEHK